MIKRLDLSHFGTWFLGYPIEKALQENIKYKLYDTPVPMKEIVKEIQGDELEEFRLAGAATEFDDEKLYDSKNNLGVNYLGLMGWDYILATHKGSVYKIALTYRVEPSYLDYVNEKLSEDLNGRFGKPKKKFLNKSQRVWENDGVRVRVAFRNFPTGEKQVNLIAQYTEEQ